MTSDAQYATASEYAIAQVQRQLTELTVAERRVDDQLPPRRRRKPGDGSMVYSFRLDPGEVAALHRRADVLGVRPTVLARNLVRAGLTRPRREGDLRQAVDRLEAAVDEVRALAD